MELKNSSSYLEKHTCNSYLFMFVLFNSFRILRQGSSVIVIGIVGIVFDLIIIVDNSEARINTAIFNSEIFFSTK